MYEPFFHTTYTARLKSIAERGLVIGAARSIGTTSYDAHAQQGVFLSGPDGVAYWYEKAQAFANDRSDDVVADGLVPVVLRFYVEEDDEMFEDDVANSESVHADAWISPEPIDRDELEVWDGAEWISIEHWEYVDPEQGAEWEEVDEEVGYWTLPLDPPLLPSGAKLEE